MRFQIAIICDRIYEVYYREEDWEIMLNPIVIVA